jgi:hypothetical protein
MKLMNKGQITNQSQVLVGRKPADPGKKKDINVKVTKDVHRRLGNIGKITEDYGDVIERLLEFWEKHHKDE